MKNWMLKHIGAEGHPIVRAVLWMILVPSLLTIGYMGNVAHVWYDTPSCQKAGLYDLNPFAFQNPEALTDKELACVIKNSNWPREEWPNVFKHAYCESSKVPHAVTEYGEHKFYGLLQMMDSHAAEYGLSSAAIFILPEEAMKWSHQLWLERKWQPWFTDSSKIECFMEGPSFEQDGVLVRNGWDFAEPTFTAHFATGTEKVFKNVEFAFNELFASND